MSKGLHFCPNSDIDTFEVIKDVHLFVRRLLFKSIYSKETILQSQIPHTDEALDDLFSLLEESDPTDLIDKVDIEALLQQHVDTKTEPPVNMTTFKKKSDRFPPLSDNPNLAAFVNFVTADIKKIHRHKCRTNLTKEEMVALQSLKAQDSVTIKPADKGRNIVIMTNTQYKTMCQ